MTQKVRIHGPEAPSRSKVVIHDPGAGPEARSRVSMGPATAPGAVARSAEGRLPRPGVQQRTGSAGAEVVLHGAPGTRIKFHKEKASVQVLEEIAGATLPDWQLELSAANLRLQARQVIEAALDEAADLNRRADKAETRAREEAERADARTREADELYAISQRRGREGGAWGAPARTQEEVGPSISESMRRAAREPGEG